MIETGQKLQQARQRKQISIEEAARATRMRPDKIADLENDNYTNFPNMTYAKGFLLIYAKFLQVDVSDFVETLAPTNPVGTEDYEYLNASERRETNKVYRVKRRNLWPFFTAALVIAAASAMFLFYLTLRRIATSEPAAPEPLVDPAIAAASPIVRGVASPERTIPVLVAEAVASPAPSASPALPPVAPVSPAPKDIVLKPLKKTWVKVRKDVADSPPIFEDWLFPDARALKFRGVKFWIEVQDPAALEITRDGLPIVMDSSKVIIE